MSQKQILDPKTEITRLSSIESQPKKVVVIIVVVVDDVHVVVVVLLLIPETYLPNRVRNS